MDDQIVAIYCVCDDLLKELRHHEDRQCQMSDAEVMTTALVAALFFGGSHEHARDLLDSPRYVPRMLSRSRFNRRLHRLAPLFEVLFARLAEMWKRLNDASAYIIDTFPVAALDNIRIWRARLYQDEAFRGYIPSKKRYFYGLRLCLMTTVTAEPVEAFFVPGSMSDAEAVKRYEYDLPQAASWKPTAAAPTTRPKTCSPKLKTSCYAPCARRTRRARYRPGSSTSSSTGARWSRPPAA